MNVEPRTAAEHQARIDQLVIVRETSPTEANRLLLAQALHEQGVAAGTRP